MSEKIYFEGDYYNSYYHLYTHKGVAASTFQKRMKKGWSLHECVYGKAKTKKQTTQDAEPKNTSTKSTTENHIVFEGNSYSSISALCRAKKVSHGTFRKRKNKGWSIEECVYGRKKDRKNTKPIEFRGIIYPSYRDLCKKYNVEYAKFVSRKNVGKWSIEECIFGRNEGSILFEDKRYKSFADLCRDKNVKYQTFKQRMKNGYSLEESIYGKRDNVVFEGENFSSFKELCSKYGVNYGTFIARKNKGYSLPECIYGKEKVVSIKNPEKRIDSKKDIKYLGKVYSSYNELCEKFNVNYDSFKERMLKGWYIDDCIYGRVTDDNSPGIEYNGVVYESLKRLCEKFNVKLQKLHYRMNTLGWSLGKALNHKEESSKYDGIYYKWKGG